MEAGEKNGGETSAWALFGAMKNTSKLCVRATDDGTAEMCRAIIIPERKGENTMWDPATTRFNSGYVVVPQCNTSSPLSVCNHRHHRASTGQFISSKMRRETRVERFPSDRLSLAWWRVVVVRAWARRGDDEWLSTYLVQSARRRSVKPAWHYHSKLKAPAVPKHVALSSTVRSTVLALLFTKPIHAPANRTWMVCASKYMYKITYNLWLDPFCLRNVSHSI